MSHPLAFIQPYLSPTDLLFCSRMALVPTTLNYTGFPYAPVPANLPFPFSKPFSIPNLSCPVMPAWQLWPTKRTLVSEDRSTAAISDTTPLAFAPSEFWVVPSVSFLSNDFEARWVWSCILCVFCLACCPVPLNSTMTEDTRQTMCVTIVKHRLALKNPGL